MQAEATPEKTILALPSALTLENVEDFYTQLRKVEIKNGMTFELNAQNLSSITTPGMQVIISLARTVAQAEGKIHISWPTPSLKEAFKILGLDSEYEAWTRTE